jgi:hypothetical protein
MTVPAVEEIEPPSTSPNPNSKLASAPPQVSAPQTQGHAVANASTAEGTEWWRDYLPRKGESPEQWYRRHPVALNWLAGYILVSGLFGLMLVRPPLMRWYRSQVWLVAGTGPVDILLRKIWFRLGFELFIYAIACVVGAIGGWLLVFFMRRGKQTSSSRPSVGLTGEG